MKRILFLSLYQKSFIIKKVIIMINKERKEKILKLIRQSDKPLSASFLAKHFNVSRQIIVGDVALLRASGHKIIATPRGYIIEKQTGHKETIAVKHHRDSIEEEMNMIVDLGGCIDNVIVEHPVYGEIKANLHISSRYDVSLFMDKFNKGKAQPLSTLTDGVHLHTISYNDPQTMIRIKESLDKRGFLLKEK